MHAPRWLSPLFLVIAVFSGVALWLEGQEASQLRRQITLLREENRKLGPLRAENQRLAALVPSSEKLAALRADHAAVARLRSEMQKLQDDLEGREQALLKATP